MAVSLKGLGDWLGVRHPEDTGIFFTTRRTVLYARILILTGFAILLTFIKDALDQGFSPVPIAVFVLLVVVIIAFALNKNGYPLASRVIFLLLLNTVIGLLCSVIPPERLAFVYFFPLIIIAFVIFDDHQKHYRQFFVSLSSIILLMLVVTDFKLFWDYELSVSELGQRNMIINMIVNILLISFCIDFLIRTNKRAEENLRNQAVYIQQQNVELKKINTELDRFVYSASHDLRAPLVSIQGLSKLAMEEAQNETDKKYFSLINDRVVRLDDFIRDIIEYSRNARTEQKLESFALEPMISEIIENLKYIQGADKIAFQVECIVSEVYTDKNRFKVVLSNIIANAIKYHNLRREDPHVKISAAVENQKLNLSIADNGVGIPKDSLTKIFDMFYRASDRAGGSGLGLYIVKEMVEKLEGTISVESEFGEGTTFSVTIPLQSKQ
ncbi:MAG: HAMP domain-containing histidine kinase [Cyclobacteriaceae bacterium]|nr:HAMP domain-containing histidine kinase [Cyclobacteriaceae bacterium]